MQADLERSLATLAHLLMDSLEHLRGDWKFESSEASDAAVRSVLSQHTMKLRAAFGTSESSRALCAEEVPGKLQRLVREEADGLHCKLIVRPAAVIGLEEAAQLLQST